MRRKSYQALPSIDRSAWALPPIVRHRLDAVVRRAARGERDAIALLVREFRWQMVEHAAENLARFDMDAASHRRVRAGSWT
jgi:hypothetical protein